MKVDANMKKRYDGLAKTVMANLEKRSFEVYYVDDAEAAKEKALSLIPEGAVVSWGGTMTAEQIGLMDELKSGKYKIIDRNSVKEKAEKEDLMRQALLCDTFIMSANAISIDGEVVNIDGRGNRLAALCYGPKEIIMIAGMNKVAGDLNSAIERARKVAAPINMQRTLTGAPCETCGTCLDCITQKTICAQVLVTRVCKPVGRIKVILVGEDLGY